MAALLAGLGLGGEAPLGPPQAGLHPGPGAPVALVVRSMLGLAVEALEGGLLLPGPRRAALEAQRAELRQLVAAAERQHGKSSRSGSGGGGGGSGCGGESLASLQRRLAAVDAALERLPGGGQQSGSQQRRPLSARVAAHFAALEGRMAATPHAELHTAAASQAEVNQQLWESGALEGRDWVLVAAAGSGGEACGAHRAAAMLSPDAAGQSMPLREGRCIVSASDGQQVFDAQPTDCRRAVALGRAHLALLQQVMEQHAEQVAAAGGRPAWASANPAHQALYW